jgi:hypothetical protein
MAHMAAHFWQRSFSGAGDTLHLEHTPLSQVAALPRRMTFQSHSRSAFAPHLQRFTFRPHTIPRMTVPSGMGTAMWAQAIYPPKVSMGGIDPLS